MPTPASPVAVATDAARIFPGLKPFEEQDAALFFGRDEQVDGLLRRLDSTRFLAILGLSGSGKSSLVRAGLLPALRRGHLGGAGARWRIAVMRPGSDPLTTLGQALDETLGTQEGRGELLRSGALGLLDASREGRGPQDNLLLVVDQFEEIFRFRRDYQVRENDATEFVGRLLAAVREYEAEYRVYVVITMRSDYLGEAALFEGLPEALNESQYLVPRMKREQLREAIEGPAALGSVDVAPELIEQLLQKTGNDPDELPVLQHLLMRMWEVRETGTGTPRIGLAQLQQVGGWDDALTHHAKAMYAQLGSEPRRELAKRIFQRLTEKGEASRESRRPTRLRELAAVADVDEEQVKAVVEHFRMEGCNFLTASDGVLSGDSLIDISHESLIRRWTDLRRWVREEAESGDWYRRVDDARRLHDQGKARWLVNPQLAAALLVKESGRWNEAWASRYEAKRGRPAPAQAGNAVPVASSPENTLQPEKRPGFALDPLPPYERAMAFLDGSRRSQRLRRLLATGMIAIVVIVVGVAIHSRSNELESRKDERRASLTAAIAAPDPLVRALLLARLSDVAGERDLQDYQTTAAAPIPLAVLRGPREEGALIAAAFSQDASKQVATVAKSGVVRWWNSDGRDSSTSFQIGARTAANASGSAAHPPLTAVAFSADVRLLAVGFADGSGWVGNSDGSGGSVSIASRDSRVQISALAFSPDDHELLAGYSDYQLRLWTLPALGADSVPLDGTSALGGDRGGHQGPISGVAFDPRSRRVATAAWDRTIRIWSLDDPSKAAIQFSAIKADLPPTSLAYSRDGKWLLCTYDDMARMWWSDEQRAPLVLQANLAQEVGVRLEGAWLSPDASRVVTALSDGSTRVWKIRLPEERAARGPGSIPAEPGLQVVGSAVTLGGHEAAVHAVAFSADGAKIVTVSEDGTARVWWSEPREPLMLGNHSGRVESVAFSPDGTRVVSASDDKSARIWSVDGQAGPLASLAGHQDWVRGATFSPDGRMVVTASEDGTWSIWSVAPRVAGQTLSPIRTLHDSPMLSIAFNADGTRVVTTTKEAAKIWDLARPDKPAVVVRGHTDWVWGAAFSPDSSRIVTASADGTARIWNAADGVEIGEPLVHEDRVLSAGFSPDGSAIVTASADKTARIWRHGSGGWSTAAVLWHDDSVNRAAFSSNGLWVVTASDDGNARIWDAMTGSLRLKLPHGSRVGAAAFNPDSSSVATGSDDGRIRIWKVTVPKLVDLLRNSSTACLTQDLRVRFLGESEKVARSGFEECEGSYGR